MPWTLFSENSNDESLTKSHESHSDSLVFSSNLRPLCCHLREACSPHQTSDRPVRHRKTSGPAARHTPAPWSLRRRRHAHVARPAPWLRPAGTLNMNKGSGLVCLHPDDPEAKCYKAHHSPYLPSSSETYLYLGASSVTGTFLFRSSSIA